MKLQLDARKVLEMERQLKAQIEQQAETIKALECEVQKRDELISVLRPVANAALNSFTNLALLDGLHEGHKDFVARSANQVGFEKDLNEAIIKWQTMINIEDE